MILILPTCIFSWAMFFGDEPYDPAIFILWGLSFALVGTLFGVYAYRKQRKERGRDAVAWHRIAEDGRVCIPLPRHDRYTVWRLRTRRDDRRTRPVMQVHLVGGRLPRVLGIVRSEKGPCMRGRGVPKCY